MSSDKKSGGQKFISSMGFKSLEFKCPVTKSLVVKSSFLAWGSKVWCSNVQWLKVHPLLGVEKSSDKKLHVQKSKHQKSIVQKFLFSLGFKSPLFNCAVIKSSFPLGIQKFGGQTSGFKRESSNVRCSKVPKPSRHLYCRSPCKYNETHSDFFLL